MGLLGSISTSVATPPVVFGCSTIGVKVLPPSVERKSPKLLATINVLPVIATLLIFAPAWFEGANTEPPICVQVTPPSVDLSRPQPERKLSMVVGPSPVPA